MEFKPDELLKKTAQVADAVVDPGTGIGDMAYALANEHVTNRPDAIERALGIVLREFVAPVATEFRQFGNPTQEHTDNPHWAVLAFEMNALKLGMDALTWAVAVPSVARGDIGTAIGVKLLANIAAPHALNLVGAVLSKLRGSKPYESIR